jgi:hypothetical protein
MGDSGNHNPMTPRVGVAKLSQPEFSCLQRSMQDTAHRNSELNFQVEKKPVLRTAVLRWPFPLHHIASLPSLRSPGSNQSTGLPKRLIELGANGILKSNILDVT